MNVASLHLPDIFEEGFHRYLVHDRLEIVSILRTLQTRRIRVTLGWRDNEFALSTLLAVNPEFEEMVFDCGINPDANRALMHAERILISATVDGIRVQFNARHADATVHEGYPALRMRLPELVMRLQRRDSFRVPASLGCQVVVESADSVRALELRTADLSLSGIALICDKSYLQLECGQLIESAHIELGSVGTLDVALEVRNLSESTTRNGLRLLRIGCQFATASRAMEALISRYIAQKERDRITRT
jgi:c-di-GMP-binding flagellar brake protein YcgR